MTDQSGRTFAEKLDHLFRTIHPSGARPYTYEQVVTGLAERGYEMSISYLWNLRKGTRDNPTLHHMQGLATFFGVPTAYFLDDDVESRINEQLDTLGALRDANVRSFALRAHGLDGPDLQALNAMLTSLRLARGLDTEADGPAEEE